ncbi:MAG: DNA mismatch repair endonuclease MutL [Candidatus Koribacter versatilis]|uniref:DNA mismatch repair protein MutL n=1 Tax=Candidatus Korobacter versatilis TaxID=658062 RepID=A0A932A9V2_9BACT|nr:DNA mismatch repair endonuclease MutL [Candidatus Koribacter versatilis]
MGRIHVLPEHVANKIAAGEVVERPASVVKELLENALDAGARRIRVDVEAGGKKLIRVTDDGCGMVRDDAMLAFERHATSKVRDADDLLNISTLGFRGEALPSIASVSRLKLETHSPDGRSGTLIEIAGGKIQRIEEAGLPAGTAIAVRDLFFNIPARKKFLKAETTELSHIAQLVTHYALAHPEKYFELHSATNAMLVAAPVATHAERLYQIFGKDTLDQMIPLTAEQSLDRTGLPLPPPWVIERMAARGEEWHAPEPGELKLHGFVSKPEIQKLNRNSMFVFVNGRLIRDRLVQHALADAYRNMLPSAVYPVVLLFLEMPPTEVDCNVHPAKTEVRFRQQTAVHDFVRDAVRAALMKARPVPQFTREIAAQPTAGAALTPGARAIVQAAAAGVAVESLPAEGDVFLLQAPSLPAINANLQFDGDISIDANAALPMVPRARQTFGPATADCEPDVAVEEVDQDEPVLATLKPLGQLRESFILAVNGEGLWIIDQHVAHERILFERILKQRAAERVESQRMLMPMVLELSPAQHAVFGEIADELRRNGFDAEPFGARTVAVKTAPAGIDASDVERLLHEVLDQFEREEQATNIEQVRGKIAASIACHAAIKINMPLAQDKMEWLLRELSRTDAPMTCPHGRPVVLKYSLKDIQRAFKRI